jgi:hypothetical protein
MRSLGNTIIFILEELDNEKKKITYGLLGITIILLGGILYKDYKERQTQKEAEAVIDELITELRNIKTTEGESRVFCKIREAEESYGLSDSVDFSIAIIFYDENGNELDHSEYNWWKNVVIVKIYLVANTYQRSCNHKLVGDQNLITLMGE